MSISRDERGAVAVLMLALFFFVGALFFGAVSLGNYATRRLEARNAGNALATAAAWQCLDHTVQAVSANPIATTHAVLANPLGEASFVGGTDGLTADIEYWTLADENADPDWPDQPTWAHATVLLTVQARFGIGGTGLDTFAGMTETITMRVRAGVRQEMITRDELILAAPLFVPIIDMSSGGLLPVDTPVGPRPMTRVIRDVLIGGEGIFTAPPLLENDQLRSRVQIGGVIHANVVFDYIHPLGGYPVKGAIPITYSPRPAGGIPDLLRRDYERALTRLPPPYDFDTIACGGDCEGNMLVGLQQAETLLANCWGGADIVYPDMYHSYLLVYADGVPYLPGGITTARNQARSFMRKLLRGLALVPKVDAALVLWLDRAGADTAGAESFIRSLAEQDPEGYVPWGTPPAPGQSVFFASDDVDEMATAFTASELDVKCFSEVLGEEDEDRGPFPDDPVFAFARAPNGIEFPLGRVETREELDSVLDGDEWIHPQAFWWDKVLRRLVFGASICDRVFNDNFAIIVRYGRPRLLCRTDGDPVQPEDC